tara:strand:- start:642 stop:932 length:291 start_codon:yes stop_codon:yes gene_type:complete
MTHVPSDGSNSLFVKKKDSVVYVLDGNAHFTSVVEMLERLSANNITPTMIVVAIPNTITTRDLTYSKAKPSHPLVPKELASDSGGDKNFLSFIEKN